MAIYVTGDVHGDTRRIDEILVQIENPSEDDVIIIAGDAGIEYGYYIGESLKFHMGRFPGSWVVMRGNHDNRYWNSRTINGVPNYGWYIEGGEYLVEYEYPNIKYVKDEGGWYDIDGTWIFFVPGAYSVDRYYRLRNGWAFEWNEMLTPREMEKLEAEANEKVHCTDYIISHTAPLSAEYGIVDLFMGGIDQSSVDKDMEIWLDKLNLLFGNNIKKHYFGHFHDDREIGSKYRMLFHDVVKIA